MPDWTSNLLIVNGPQAEVDRLLDEVRGQPREGSAERAQRPLDFERHLPTPRALFEDESGISVADWRADNWGTKWLPDGVELKRPLKEAARLRFATAWAPPTPWLRVVAAQFPKLAFELTFDLQTLGDGLDHTIRIVDGDEETEGFAVYAADDGEPDWVAAEAAIPATDADAIHWWRLARCDAPGLEFGDYEEDGPDGHDLEGLMPMLEAQLAEDLTIVRREFEEAAPLPIRRRRGRRELSYLIGSVPAEIWKARLTELRAVLSVMATPAGLGSPDQVQRTEPEVGYAVGRLSECGILAAAGLETAGPCFG